jgi:hypothetical protein
LAGGQYPDIGLAFGICESTFYNIIWPTIDAIDNVLDNIEFPYDNDEALRKLRKGFEKFTHGKLPGCVMAVDGWVVRTRCPYGPEVTYGEEGIVGSRNAYYNRKGFYGLVVFAGCDSNCRFLMLSAKCSGSTNDCIAWRETNVYRDIIAANKLPPEHYIAADEGLECTETVLTPYSGIHLEPVLSAFNFYLSSMRQCIERAFGMMTRRWGIFWRRLEADFNRWSLIIGVCAKLHNFLIDMNDAEIVDNPDDFADDDDFSYVLNDSDELIQDATSFKRNVLAAHLHSNGHYRPSV